MKTEEKYLTEETSGGHGEKWEVFSGDDEEWSILKMLPFAMEHSEIWQNIDDDPAITRSGMFQAAVLFARGNESDDNGIVMPLARSSDLGVDSPNLTLVSAFPFFAHGLVLSCEVQTVEYFPDTIEGRLWLVCEELPFELCIFDTRFALRRTRYTNDGDYRFSVAALAYSIASTADDTVVIDDPEQIRQHRATRAWVERSGAFSRETDLEAALEAYEPSGSEDLEPIVFNLSQMTMLMPDDVYSDDAQYSGKIVGIEQRATMIYGTSFDRIEIEIGQEGRKVRLPLYVSEYVLGRDGHSPKVGEFIRGRCWMQGYMIDE